MAAGAPANETTEKTPPEGTTPAATPPAKEAPPAKAAPTPAPQQAGEKAPPKVTTEQGERKRATLKSEDDDIPDDADLIEMTPRALKSRITRASKKELKDRFGTDDPDEITAKLKRLEALEAADKKRSEEELTEKQRLEKERDEHKARAEAAELRAKEVYEERLIDRQDTRMSRIAERAGVDPDYYEVEFPKLAAWLKKNHTKEELKKLSDKAIANYWKERLEAKPKLARDFEEKRATEKKPKAPLDNGVNPTDRPNANPSGAAGAKKSYAPGRPDSMTTQEARAEMRKEGYQY